MLLQDAPLGRQVPHVEGHAPELLCPLPRARGRAALGLPAALPFGGTDLWTAYELSWLGPRGKPEVAVAELTVPATSPQLIESKSLKLYLNALGGVRLADVGALRALLRDDLSRAAGAPVGVAIDALGAAGGAPLALPGDSLDGLDVAVPAQAQVDPTHLVAQGAPVCETLHSHLLRSRCPMTGQPDWGSLVVRYCGPALSHAGLLRYIVSYRHHSGFHEQCVEGIFVDLKRHCAPTQLTVYAAYTRRGGLDINPFRSDFEAPPRRHRRTFRQ